MMHWTVKWLKDKSTYACFTHMNFWLKSLKLHYLCDDIRQKNIYQLLKVITRIKFTNKHNYEVAEFHGGKFCNFILLFLSAAYRECLLEDHKCGNGLCIPPTRKCDGYFDCRDESDEAGCNMTSCTKDKFRCNDLCINKSQKCDHRKDCDDNSDEEDCGKLSMTVMK